MKNFMDNSPVTSIEEHEPLSLAKLVWADPQTAETHEYVLLEGATATIGRDDDNDICIQERHVSRQHAVINYRDGVFTIVDLGSHNGTFVNDQRLHGMFPLKSGDTIRLFVPLLLFSATVSPADQKRALETGKLIPPAPPATGSVELIITNGPHEGETITLLLDQVTLGRATSNAEWEICLQDPTVSRPHARLERDDDGWTVRDLESSNGTSVNGQTLDGNPKRLQHGDVIGVGNTLALFRVT